MAGALAPRVDDAGVTPMRRRERAPQPVRVGRRQDEMHRVRHPAPCPNLDAGGPAMLAEQVAIEGVVGVGEERARAAIAALGDVMRQAGDDDAGEAGHAA